MAIVVTNEIISNYAEFKNDESEDENQGTCTWDAPVFDAYLGVWVVRNVVGTNVQGEAFDIGTLEDIDEESRLNPSKVFKWIMRKAYRTLCPNCM